MNNKITHAKDMPESIVDAQVQRLLEIVNDYERHQCETMLEIAREESKKIIRHTYRNARNRLRSHILEDRQQLEQSLASVRAKRHTFIMQQKHQASQVFLNESWSLLKEKLKQRWSNKKQREVWLKTIAEIALVYLSSSDWRIEHSQDLSTTEIKQLKDYLSNHSERKLEFSRLDTIDVGLRIIADDAIVDGTIKGLLADRVRIESEILAQCTNCIVHSSASDEQSQEEDK